MSDFKEKTMPQSDQFKNKRLFVSKWLEKKNSMYQGMSKFKKLYPQENFEFGPKKKTGWTNIEIYLLDHLNAIIKTSMFVNNKVKSLMDEMDAKFSTKHQGYVLPLGKLDNLYTVLSDETYEIKNTVSKIPEWVIEAIKNNATPHKIS